MLVYLFKSVLVVEMNCVMKYNDFNLLCYLFLFLIYCLIINNRCL